jgi:hypothetical protein
MAKQNRPNKGQDEIQHTFTNDAGDEVQGTMREFRESLRDQGYRKPDDAADVEPVEDAEAVEDDA